jgi:hypothetical protein
MNKDAPIPGPCKTVIKSGVMTIVIISYSCQIAYAIAYSALALYTRLESNFSQFTGEKKALSSQK